MWIESRGNRGSKGKPAARLFKGIEHGVADAEQPAPQCRKERDGVVRVSDRPETSMQEGELFHFVQGSPAGDLVRDSQLLQLATICSKVLLAMRDDHEVTGICSGGR